MDSQGGLVQGTDGKPIQIPSGKLSVGADGTVSVDAAVIGQIKLVDFSSNGLLTPDGNSDFAAPATARHTWFRPAQVRQGTLESSNSGRAIGSAVALIDLQRNAEMMQRALTIFNTDFNQTAVQELPKRLESFIRSREIH